MMVKGGFGKAYMVIDRHQAIWLSQLLLELANKQNGEPLRWNEADTREAKSLADIIQAGDTEPTWNL